MPRRGALVLIALVPKVCWPVYCFLEVSVQTSSLSLRCQKRGFTLLAAWRSQMKAITARSSTAGNQKKKKKDVQDL
ncbi:hypothetical protein BCR43DRAFT_490989, partial [Syncephalastrum racemosum]